MTRRRLWRRGMPPMLKSARRDRNGSSNRFLLLRCRNPTRFCLCFGLGQEAEARLAPREIDAHVQQSIGTPAWAGKFHDCEDTVGLSDSQRHRPSCGMVRRGVDAQNQITRADSVAHRLHPICESLDRDPLEAKSRLRPTHAEPPLVAPTGGRSTLRRSTCATAVWRAPFCGHNARDLRVPISDGCVRP